MRLDYHGIKALGRELGVTVPNLLAMTSSADPFYVGPARDAEARWFADLWTRFQWGQGMHLRRAHYRLVTLADPVIKPTGDPYVNDGASWGLMKRASLAARYLNLIPAGSLVDRKNPDPIIFARQTAIAGKMPTVGIDFRVPFLLSDLPLLDIDTDAKVYPPSLGISDLADGQPYVVEVWIEKTTMNDILVPLCQRLGVNLVPGQGDTSEILARSAVERAIEAGRPMRILYVSDFDPRGHNMPIGLARKIEFLLRDSEMDLDITLDPIALKHAQCEQYNLPRKPFEKGGSARFEEQFGEGGTELDALEAILPGTLAEIVEREVQRYIDPTLSGRCSAATWTIWRQLRGFSKEVLGDREKAVEEVTQRSREIRQMLQSAIERTRAEMDQLQSEASALWEDIAEDLDGETVEIDSDLIPKPRPANPPEAPLFDSKRDYLDQIDHYRAAQGRGVADVG